MDKNMEKRLLTNNFWNELEYSKLKLLLNHDKADSVLDVLHGKKRYDELPPLSVELHLTNQCNLKCSWCTDQKLRRNGAFQKKETIMELFHYFGRNRVGVTIEGGGEPSMHKDFEEIVLYGSKLGLDMGLISNGVIDYSHLIAHFKWVRISLDAASPEEFILEKGTDRFGKVMKNLKEFSNSRDVSQTHLGVGYVLTTRNMDHILNMMPALDAIGVDYIYLRPVEEAAPITPGIDRLYDLRKSLIKFTRSSRIQFLLTIHDRLIKNNDSLPCFAHSLSCIIHANGDISLCEKRRHDPVLLGNINRMDFSTIWKSDFRKEVSQKLLLPENQAGCDVCRITSFNRVLYDVSKIHTKNFI